MKRYRHIGAVVFLFLLWELIAIRVDNDWLIPYPMDVLRLMASQTSSALFYQTILATLLRVIFGLVMAFITAFGCAVLSYRFRIFKDLFYPFLLLMRSVPNISYIIIILLWFGSESSSTMVNFLILFPILYANLYQGLVHQDPHLLKVLDIYPVRKKELLFRIYLPLLKAEILASLSSGLSLGLKVGVMSEILGQVSVGIGRQMNLSRLSYDMNGVFSWTGWIILLLMILDGIFHYCLHQHKES